MTETKLPPEEINARTDGPIHLWFELSYSNYAVLHRTLMQSMPVEWQQRMVRCLEELDEAFGHIERAPGYEVKACRWTYVADLDNATEQRLGITSGDWDSDDPDAEIVYYDRDGNELGKNTACVPVPVAEPVPRYNRGRTFIEPRSTS